MSFIQPNSAPGSMIGRWLEEIDITTISSNERSNTTTAFRDSSILRDMAVVYGSVLIVVFFVFCLVRKVFPGPYTVRRWADDGNLKVCSSCMLVCVCFFLI